MDEDKPDQSVRPKAPKAKVGQKAKLPMTKESSAPARSGSKAKAKGKAKAASKPPEGDGHLVDWMRIGAEVEAELREKGWTSAMQRRNPRYLHGVVLRLIVRPLTKAIAERL